MNLLAFPDHFNGLFGAFDLADSTSLAIGIVYFRNAALPETYDTVRAINKTDTALVAFVFVNRRTKRSPIPCFTDTAFLADGNRDMRQLPP
jgi:hypothetical protein